MHIRFYTFLFFLLGASIQLVGQNLEHYEKYALGAYHSKNYSTALFFSQKVIEVDSLNITSLFIAGQAAKYLEKYEQAEMYLERIPDRAKIGYFSACDFELAMVKLNLKKYDDAIIYFKKYLIVNSAKDDLLTKYAEQELQVLEQMSEEDKTSFLYRAKPLPDNINSEFTEIAPLRYGDKIYFTSAYKADEKSAPVSRIFEATRHYPARIVAVNPRDGSLNACNVALMPDASRMYYTLCNDKDYRQQKDCTIWYREKEYEGNWGPPVKLPSHINLRNYTTTQPSVGWDKTLKKFVLYFSSNRPGGNGNMDIWAAAIERDGTFGEPFHLPFNTPEDDVTPFYHQVSQTLFFSSNGWPNLGGLDVFRSSNENGTWTPPENLGNMINTSYDDYYYSFHTGSGNAYFSSNRPGNPQRISVPQTDNDLYVARVFIDVRLQAFNAEDSTQLKSLSVIVEDLSINSMGTFNARPDETQLIARLEAGKNYRLTLMAEGFEPATFELSTLENSYITELKRDLYLKLRVKP